MYRKAVWAENVIGLVISFADVKYYALAHIFQFIKGSFFSPLVVVGYFLLKCINLSSKIVSFFASICGFFLCLKNDLIEFNHSRLNHCLVADSYKGFGDV